MFNNTMTQYFGRHWILMEENRNLQFIPQFLMSKAFVLTVCIILTVLMITWEARKKASCLNVNLGAEPCIIKIDGFISPFTLRQEAF